MSPPAGLCVDGLRKRFGGVAALDGVSLALDAGELHALIGPNGAGKTTFIQVLSGADRADAGSIVVDATEIAAFPMHRRVRLGVARSYQISSLFANFSVLENIALAIQARSPRPFAAWEPLNADTALVDRATDALNDVGLAARAEIRAGDLAHGEKRQLDLGLALATGARLLLLDEPMAGLGAADAAKFVALLAALKGRVTIVLVEHDMDTVFRLADRISVLVYGRIVATGTPEEIRRHAEVRRAYLGEEAEGG